MLASASASIAQYSSPSPSCLAVQYDLEQLAGSIPRSLTKASSLGHLEKFTAHLTAKIASKSRAPDALPHEQLKIARHET
jgi:hypothetical protein